MTEAITLTTPELNYLIAKLGGDSSMSLIRPGDFGGSDVLTLQFKLEAERNRRMAE